MQVFFIVVFGLYTVGHVQCICIDGHRSHIQRGEQTG